MTDDHGLLRQTLSDLAEQGGHADLYERSLRTSKRLTRNRRIMTVAAALVVIAGIGTPFALADSHKSAPSPQILVPPSVEPTNKWSPAPSPSPSSSRVEVTTSHPRTESSAPRKACPVTAGTLADAVNGEIGSLSKVECHSGYAAAVAAPLNGSDGAVAIFRYDAAAAKWHLVGEGSAEVCEAYMPSSLWDAFDACGSAGGDNTGGCPVTASQLKAASPNAPAPFEKIECHEDVAMAVVPESEDPDGYDAAVYIFDYREGGWQEIAQGSALNCYDYMPGTMAAHFSYCD